MFKNIGTPEVVIVAIVILILFGAKKIPEFVRGIGEAIKEFKKASKS